MNPFKTIFLCAVLATAPIACLTTGCSTTKSPATIAVKVSDASQVSVMAALRAWNEFIPVGRPSINQQRQVKAAWQKYQTAQLGLLDAALLLKQDPNLVSSQTGLNKAAAVSAQALADLVSLLRQFGVKI